MPKPRKKEIRVRYVDVPNDGGDYPDDVIPVPGNTRSFKQMARIDQMRYILEHGYQHINRKLVDSFSASAYVKVYDALNETNRAKLEAMPIGKAMSVVWKFIK
jgi:hypothetical protein